MSIHLSIVPSSKKSCTSHAVCCATWIILTRLSLTVLTGSSGAPPVATSPLDGNDGLVLMLTPTFDLNN